MKRKILYYPTIDIKDSVWLRNAILYWDQIASVVPTGYDERELSPDLKYLLEKDVYVPIRPEELYCSVDLRKQFETEILDKMDYFTELKSRERKSRGEKHRIHMDKLSAAIREEFLKRGIVECEEYSDLWLSMNNEASVLYMSILAKYISRCKADMCTGTDYKKNFHYGYDALKTDTGSAYMQIVWQDILPVPNTSVSYEAILDFKNEYKRELKEFQNSMAEFQRNVKNAEDIAQINAMVKEYKDELEETLAGLDDKIRLKRIETIKKTIGSFIPIVGSVALDYLTGIPAPAVLASKVLFEGALSIFGGESKRKEIVEEDELYLFYAKKSNIIVDM